MTVTPSRVTAAPGDDQATLITLAADGFPVIEPIAPPPDDEKSFPARAADGPATVLLHAEDAEMRDLRQQHLRGRIAGGVFAVESRRGSLAPTPPPGWWAQLMQQLEFRRLGRDGRRRIEAWK